MDALFSMIDGCCIDEIDDSEYKEADDDILTEFCSKFNYDDLNHGYKHEVLPVKGYGNHGFGKILKLPNDYLHDDDEEDEVNHLPVKETTIHHGREKVLRINPDRLVSKKTTEEEKVDVDDEVEMEVNKALMEVFGEDDKVVPAVNLKSIAQLSKDELEAKLELSKAKLRSDYQNTLPTRHSKVLEIDQIPDLKRSKTSGQDAKKVASAAPSVRAHPKRKLQQEARGIYKRKKTTSRVTRFVRV